MVSGAFDVTQINSDSSSHHPVDINEVDFEWVAACDDRRKLQEAIRLLEKEYFPDLLKCARTRLTGLGGYAHGTEQKVDRADLDSIFADLNNWADSRRQPKSSSSAAAAFASSAPIRNKVTKQRTQGDSGLPQLLKTTTTTKPTKPNLVQEDVPSKSRAQLEREAANEKQKGNECFRAQDYEQAVRFYSSSLACCPSAAVFANRALTNIKLQKNQLAEQDATSALELDSEHVKAIHRRATARHNLNRFQQAVQDCERGLELDPGNKALERQLADSRAKLPKPGFSRMVIEEASSSDEDEDEDGEKEASVQKTTKIVIEEDSGSDTDDDDDDDEILPTKARLVEDPVFVECNALKETGNQAFKAGQHSSAIESYSRAAQLLESMAHDLSRFSPSERVAASCLSASLANNCALCHQQTDQHEQVIECSSRALDSCHSHQQDGQTMPVQLRNAAVKALARRAIAHEASHDIQAAFDDMQQASRLDASFEQSRQALPRLRRALQDQRSERAQDLKLKANAVFKRGALDEAGRLWSQALTVLQVPQHKAPFRHHALVVSLLSNRALVHIKKERWTQAVQDCSVVLEQYQHDNVKAMFRRATAHKALGSFDDALRDARQALQLQPTLGDATALIRDLEQLTKPKPKIQVLDVDQKTCHIEVIDTDDEDEPPKPKPQQQQQQQAPATAKPVPAKAPQSSVAVLPAKAPRTFVDFDKQWTLLKTDLAVFAQYLQMIGDTGLASILHDNLSAQILASILHALDKHLVRVEPQFCFDLLTKLQQTQRFQLNLLFMEAGEKAALKSLMRLMMSSPKLPIPAVKKLKQAYQVS